MKKIFEKYRGLGLRLTPQRMAVIEYLEGNTAHPSAENIYREIREKHPTVSYATVYNTLLALKELGAVRELTIDPQRRHYDPDTRAHHHVICTGCGKIADVFADYSDAVKLPAEVLKDFAMTYNCVNFYGECRECSGLPETGKTEETMQ